MRTIHKMMVSIMLENRGSAGNLLRRPGLVSLDYR